MPRASQTASRGVKRSAPHTEAASEKKVRQRPSAVENPALRGITLALNEMENLNSDVRQMLVQMLPTSLGVPFAERHADQHTVVGMIGEAFESYQTVLQNSVAEEEARKKQMVEEEASARAKQVELKEAVEESRKQAADLKGALAVEAEKVAAAESAHADATKAEAVSGKHIQDLDADLVALQKVQAEDFVVLRDGAWETGGAKSHLDALQAILKGDCFDAALKSALPGACLKAPTERGDFDRSVMANLEESLGHRLTEIQAELEKANQSAPDLIRQKEVTSEQLTSAKSLWQEAADALTKGEAAAKELATQLSAEEGKLRGFGPSLKKVEKEIASKEEFLQGFQWGPLKDFTDLIQPPKQPEEITQAQAEGGA